ncbi:MAG: helix-hairpin-helix domain-containing protein [bacterium]|nr:helix-hairpin-helix domain-containing protein [bacterium]
MARVRLYAEERLALLVLTALLLAASFLAAGRRAPRAIALRAGPAPERFVRVTVIGAVGRPGERELPAPATARDAARAAGPAAGARLDALDAAAPLAPGEVVYVPREGETAAEIERRREAALRRLRGERRPRKVDINAAGADELAGLPGVGPKLAAAIIAERGRAPFRDTAEIMRVPGIGQKRYERIREHIAAGCAGGGGTE